MKMVSSARAARSPAPRSARRRLMKPLLGLAAFTALFGVLAWRLDRPSSAASLAGAAAGNPLGQLSRSDIDRAPITGVVEERLPAGSYTYLAVRTDAAVVWAVTLGDAPPPGARVRVRSMGSRTSFHSRRLDRTFPTLVFGIVSRID
ncbi:hypothetical protein WMF31_07590 [Sorangium sp. So ce1036]|uniref:hypothetical protein n=1 Tax=Sorangium sp. So ce1036 TaxID=3133328 RepID=UPI003F07DECC